MFKKFLGIIKFYFVVFSLVNSLVCLANDPSRYLFKIQSPKGKTSYLLGTVHIGISLEEMPDIIKKL